ncbi:MAG: glycosyl transferase [Muribaculaceae bacterium]|nr:glycosyl transferase [Muribaculaceae bacterium]
MDIPKIIHYCWFGRKPLPKFAIKCIESWRKYFPAYEIKEWNENNFDINIIPYISQSYKKRKFAFVSDYARYWILYRYGGLYFDTDVEVIGSFDDILKSGPFLGIEKDHDIISVAPGLCMGAYPGMMFYREMMKEYEKWEPASIDQTPPPILVKKTTELLESKGFQKIDKFQVVDDINIYPNDYFNPMDDYTGKIYITSNTRSIHHYAKSWVDNYGPLRNKLTHIYHRLLNLNSSKP